MVTLFIVNRYFQFFVFTEKYWDTGLVIEFREILAKIINRKIPSEKKNMLNYQKVVFTSLQQIIGTKLWLKEYNIDKYGVIGIYINDNLYNFFFKNIEQSHQISSNSSIGVTFPLTVYIFFELAVLNILDH